MHFSVRLIDALFYCASNINPERLAERFLKQAGTKFLGGKEKWKTEIIS